MAALIGGKTLVPLNPAEGVERLELKMNEWKEAASVFCFSENIQLSRTCEKCLPDASEIDPLPLHELSDFESSRVAICVFTSGSTGYSKVVQLTEANLLTNVDALIGHHQLNQASVIGTPLPFFHVNALGFSFLCSFAAGGRLVFFQKSDPALMIQAIREEGIKVLSIIPQVMRILLQRGKSDDLMGLSYVVTAAAPLSQELAKKFILHFGKRIIQGYGLSEAVNFSLTMPINLPENVYDQVMFRNRFPTVGIELPGNLVGVLNAEGNECGPGLEGEIGIRGWNVMPGYRQTENLREQSPYKDGYFMTGDLGFFEIESRTQTKYFFISGRSKDVVKRAGETVSLRELDDMVAAIQFKGLEAIAVPFVNEISGEQIGLVCLVDVRAVSKNWRQEFLDIVEKQIPQILRPFVLLETTREIRTPSGKPMRWMFQSAFTKYGDVSLGPKVFWGIND